MIFFPEKTLYEKPENYGLEAEEVTILTEDKVTLHGWFLEAPKAEGTILFLHGNAGNISNRIYKAKGWVERNISVLLLDYRGYGKSEGAIHHSKDILRDAQAGFKWIHEHKKVPMNQMILYGESLGSHPTLWLGTKYPVLAVILEAPFTSFKELAKKHYAYIPLPGLDLLLKDFEFSNMNLVDKLRAPLFILHGNQDEICPFPMSEALFDKAQEPKTFFSIPNGAHNDLPMIAGEDFWNKPYEFVSSLLAKE